MIQHALVGEKKQVRSISYCCCSCARVNALIDTPAIYYLVYLSKFVLFCLYLTYTGVVGVVTNRPGGSKTTIYISTVCCSRSNDILNAALVYIITATINVRFQSINLWFLTPLCLKKNQNAPSVFFFFFFFYIYIYTTVDYVQRFRSSISDIFLVCHHFHSLCCHRLGLNRVLLLS